MRLLLDTHILLWALQDDQKLPDKARNLIVTPTNRVLYSPVSIWEVAIKHAVHPDKLLVDATDVLALCEKAGYESLPLYDRHVSMLETLVRDPNAAKHNDPFDKLLLAQAKCEGLRLVSHDALLPGYNEPCLLSV